MKAESAACCNFSKILGTLIDFDDEQWKIKLVCKVLEKVNNSHRCDDSRLRQYADFILSSPTLPRQPNLKYLIHYAGIGQEDFNINNLTEILQRWSD